MNRIRLFAHDAAAAVEAARAAAPLHRSPS